MFSNSVTIGQYLPGESLIHRLDPRTKILGVLGYVVILFLVRDFSGYGVMALITAAMAGVAQVPVRMLVRGLRPVLFIIILTVALNAIMTPGEVLQSIGPLTITREGIYQAATMACRLLLLIMTTSMLTLTTAPIDLTDGLEYLLGPFRRVGIPAHELAMMMTIALRFIPTLLDEAERIMKAQMARGADFQSGGLVQRARNMVPLLVPLFVSAFRRADDLALAMEARCYRGGVGRSRFKVLKPNPVDFAVGAVMAAGFAFALVV
ncbi:MAG: energy-coupling factor transporter transmembrane component T family protein [Bacillota bacterium]